MPVLVNNFTTIWATWIKFGRNITEEVVMERFFFFLAVEGDTFSNVDLSNVDFTVFGLCPLATK